MNISANMRIADYTVYNELVAMLNHRITVANYHRVSSLALVPTKAQYTQFTRDDFLVLQARCESLSEVYFPKNIQLVEVSDFVSPDSATFYLKALGATREGVWRRIAHMGTAPSVAASLEYTSTAFSYGPIQPLDMIGPWLYADLFSVVDSMKWINAGNAIVRAPSEYYQTTYPNQYYDSPTSNNLDYHFAVYGASYDPAAQLFFSVYSHRSAPTYQVRTCPGYNKTVGQYFVANSGDAYANLSGLSIVPDSVARFGTNVSGASELISLSNPLPFRSFSALTGYVGPSKYTAYQSIRAAHYILYSF